ncbi:MAG: hypothetical protein HFE46_01460 [Clostridia bacterium]|nr:hypothetical protein [Clostridia bacterium]
MYAVWRNLPIVAYLPNGIKYYEKVKKMNKALKRNTSRILCALLVCIALTASLLSSVFTVGGIFARANDTENVTFTQVDVSPSNNQFGSGSGSTPQTPDSWTGGGINGSSAGGATKVSGILDLATYAANKDSYQLNKYPEYSGSEVPTSPFGDSTYEGTNRKVLLVHVPQDGSNGTAYGYTSSTVTFTANRFYRVSVWVRTGNFQGDSGAAIRLNGLNEDVAIHNINTYTANPTEANDYNWQRFLFYIASSSYADQSVTLSLQVGDSYTDDNTRLYMPAVGYAMFDNVQVHEISPLTFARAQEEQGATDGNGTGNYSNIRVYDLANKTNVTFADGNATGANLDFQQSVPGNGWHNTSADGDYADVYTYNSGSNTFTPDNDYGFTADPLSSNGNDFDGDTSILVISSPNKAVARGVTSDPFTVKRYHYYRVAAWVKTQDISSGNGATLALTGLRDNTLEDKKYSGQNFFATAASCTGDSNNKSRGGYAQYSIYVKGSVLRDYTATVECWLGTSDGKSSGIAFFDNVTVEEISPKDYADHSGNGNATVDFDTQAAIDGSERPSFDTTGITNGDFYQIDTYDYDPNGADADRSFRYPIAPASWSQFTPDTAETTGYAPYPVETDDISAGIIPTDAQTFSLCKEKGWLDAGTINPAEGVGSVLMLHSPVRTAFCYRSSTFTATANTPGAVSVRLWADGMQSDDYGASLVLKDGSRILATIEGIKNTDKFNTYTFYIEPDTSDAQNLSVEIWLGNGERVRNEAKSKLSAGYVYVQNVSYANLGDSEDADAATALFAEKKAACEKDLLAGRPLTRAAYSFKNVDFMAYDAYDDNFVKYPYDWSLTVNENAETVTYGIFNPNNRTDASYAYVPKEFVNSPNNNSNGILFMHNKMPAYSTMRYNGSVSLEADKYYRVDVSLRVDLPESQDRAQAKGVTLALADTAHAFKDIRETITRPDDYVTDTFRTYSFYINPGSAATTVSLTVSMGESDYSKQSSGYVYINSITYTDINDVIFTEATEETEKRDKDKTYNESYRYALVADLSIEQEEDTDNETEESKPSESSFNWLLIPSILFAVAILIAIIGFIVVKAMEKKAAKKGVVEKKASYDRAATLNKEYNKNAEEGDKIGNVTDNGDESYEAFDDTVSAEKPVAKPDATAKQQTLTANEHNETPESAPVAEEPTESTETKEHNETAQTPEQPSPQQDTEKTESAQQQDNSFIDRFDD